MTAGCGGQDSTEAPATGASTKQASAAGGDTYTCPEKTGFTYKATIKNLLPSPITLSASEYDCNDWDGIPTPGHAFTGKTMPPGEKRTFTLQPARNTTRNWTMEFTAQSGVPSFGRARLSIPKAIGNFIQVAGSTRESAPTQNRFGVEVCDFLPMEPTGAPASGWDDLECLEDVDLTVMSRDGYVTLASNCGTSGGGGKG